MAKVRFGIDQVTAWVLAVALGGALYGAGYFASKLGAHAAEDGSFAGGHGESHGESHGDEHAAPADHGASPEGHGDEHAAPAEHSTSEHTPAAEHGAASDHAPAGHEPAGHEPAGHEPAPAPKAAAQGDVAWTYTGSTGPDHWGTLTPAFKACDSGKRQSPVDIDDTANNAKLLPLRFNYKPGDMLISHDGHTVKVDVPQGNYMEVEGERFDLEQFHFHAPSEHKVSGIPYDMEMHLVHKNADGHVAMLSILFEEGAENKALNKIWNVIPNKKGSHDEPVDLHAANYLPTRRLYYTYVGSWTEPPCTEGVRWFVMTQPVTISPKQVDRFVSVAKFNARPSQPLNGRKVQKSTR